MGHLSIWYAILRDVYDAKYVIVNEELNTHFAHDNMVKRINMWLHWLTNFGKALWKLNNKFHSHTTPCTLNLLYVDIIAIFLVYDSLAALGIILKIYSWTGHKFSDLHSTVGTQLALRELVPCQEILVYKSVYVSGAETIDCTTA